MAFLGEKCKRKVNFMCDKELGLFCIDQGPVMPEMPREDSFPMHVSLAMMYVPYQRFENLYDPEKALTQGTLYKDLDLPFYGSKGGWRK